MYVASNSLPDYDNNERNFGSNNRLLHQQQI